VFRRLYTFIYAFICGTIDRVDLTALREELVAKATGATIEIGAGTGLNLRYYPAAVTHLVLVEPDPYMAELLCRRVANVRPNTEIRDAAAERLPFPDGRFDTAVVTFVLCCVADQHSALREIGRVLAPGGRMLFLEHVRSADSTVAARQDSMPQSGRLISCHPNRATLEAIESSRLSVESVRHVKVPRAPKIERSMIVGAALASSAG
jgi:ubiquinone/menaquinone biosynthesis C-methylase UbiE